MRAALMMCAANREGVRKNPASSSTKTFTFGVSNPKDDDLFLNIVLGWECQAGQIRRTKTGKAPQQGAGTNAQL